MPGSSTFSDIVGGGGDCGGWTQSEKPTGFYHDLTKYPPSGKLVLRLQVFTNGVLKSCNSLGCVNANVDGKSGCYVQQTPAW